MMSRSATSRSKPSTADELGAAKEARSGRCPGSSKPHRPGRRINTISSTTGRWTTTPSCRQKYQAITEADVARWPERYLHPDQLVIVTAGDRTKIEPGLKDAGLGPVEVRDINGNLVPAQNEIRNRHRPVPKTKARPAGCVFVFCIEAHRRVTRAAVRSVIPG